MIPCYIFQKKPCDLEKHVNIELDKIQRWLDVNKLSLNVSKTKYIIISPKLKERYKLQIKLKEHLLYHGLLNNRTWTGNEKLRVYKSRPLQ